MFIYILYNPQLLKTSLSICAFSLSVTNNPTIKYVLSVSLEDTPLLLTRLLAPLTHWFDTFIDSLFLLISVLSFTLPGLPPCTNPKGSLTFLQLHWTSVTRSLLFHLLYSFHNPSHFYYILKNKTRN